MTAPDTSSVAIAADPMPLDGFSRLTQRTVTADVVDQIKRLITLGTLVPGQRLPSERVLADLLGVSRPTTREAVRALEAMGIVSTRHGSGTFVTDLSAETLARPLIFVLDINRNALHELFAVRVLLEAGAAEAAAASADIDTCDRLAACIAEMRGAADAESFLGTRSRLPPNRPPGIRECPHLRADERPAGTDPRKSPGQRGRRARAAGGRGRARGDSGRAASAGRRGGRTGDASTR